MGNRYLRALVLVPQVDAVKGIRADDIGAGPVRGAVPLHIPGHRRLAPLGAVHGGRQGQVLPVQPAIRRRKKFTELESNILCRKGFLADSYDLWPN